MRPKTKGWRKTTKGKGKEKHDGSGAPSTNVTAKETGKCHDCGKYGHRKGDAECDHVKSKKTKSFRTHGANVITQHFLLDAEYDHEHDHDLRGTIMNSLCEIYGASSQRQTCVVSPLTAARSTDPTCSQHEIMNKATAATGTTTSTAGRRRLA